MLLSALINTVLALKLYSSIIEWDFFDIDPGYPYEPIPPSDPYILPQFCIQHLIICAFIVVVSIFLYKHKQWAWQSAILIQIVAMIHSYLLYLDNFNTTYHFDHDVKIWLIPNMMFSLGIIFYMFFVRYGSQTVKRNVVEHFSVPLLFAGILDVFMCIILFSIYDDLDFHEFFPLLAIFVISGITIILLSVRILNYLLSQYLSRILIFSLILITLLDAIFICIVYGHEFEYGFEYGNSLILIMGFLQIFPLISFLRASPSGMENEQSQQDANPLR